MRRTMFNYTFISLTTQLAFKCMSLTHIFDFKIIYINSKGDWEWNNQGSWLVCLMAASL